MSMDKPTIEAAIKRAEAFLPSTDRTNVIVNLKALLKGEAKTYTRRADVEADLADLASREANK